MKLLVQISFVTFLAMVAILCTSCNKIQKAMSKIDEGMTRAKAIETLSEDAWYYQPCPEVVTSQGRILVDDLFFFGSHDYDRAEIVIVHSTKQKDTEWTVQGVGTFESYAWHTAYRDCIKREKFDN